VLESPAEPQVIQEKSPEYYIEKGKLGGINSGIARRERAELLSQFNALRPYLQPLLKPSIELPVIAQEHSDTLATLTKQIELLDSMLKPGLKPADYRDLTAAKSKLFEMWAHLSGIPKPMAPRDSRTPSRRMTIQLPDPVPVTPPPSPK